MTDQEQHESAAGAAAALVIRVWREPGEQGSIRARITRQPDLSQDRQTTTVVASPDAVYREVQTWMEKFLERSGQD